MDADRDKRARLLGALLDNARLRQRVSIPAVAKTAEVPLSVVQKVLGGKARQPSWWAIVRIARALNVSLDDLREQCGKPEPATVG